MHTITNKPGMAYKLRVEVQTYSGADIHEGMIYHSVEVNEANLKNRSNRLH